jgi:hypothetical protein
MSCLSVASETAPSLCVVSFEGVALNCSRIAVGRLSRISFLPDPLPDSGKVKWRYKKDGGIIRLSSVCSNVSQNSDDVSKLLLFPSYSRI